MLHLKYKVFSCELKIKFKEVAGGKALATDHREMCFLAPVDEKRPGLLVYFPVWLGTTSFIAKYTWTMFHYFLMVSAINILKN